MLKNPFSFLWLLLLCAMGAGAVWMLTSTRPADVTRLTAQGAFDAGADADRKGNYGEGARLFGSAGKARDFRTLSFFKRRELELIQSFRQKPADDYFAKLVAQGLIAKWNKKKLLVYVDPALTPTAKEYIDDALKQWGAALGDKIQLQFCDTANGADLSCMLLEDENAGGEFFRGRCAFVSAMGDTAVAPASNTVVYLPLPSDEEKVVKSTYIHELGHALGLVGHSIYGDDVMFSDSRIEKLSARDKKTVVRLYADRAADDARQVLEELAAAGNVFAMVRLGEILEASDAESAFKWYEKAESRGSPDAKLRLGLCYETGIGVKASPKKALALYEDATRAGLPEAYCRLGQALERGLAGKNDYAGAEKEYRRASEMDYAPAYYLLAGLAQTSKGSVVGKEEAVELLETSVRMGYAPAMTMLGQLLVSGRYTEGKDFERACKLFREAADAGDGRALLELGVMYYRGCGVEQDVPAAIELWKKAEAAGLDEARGYISRAKKEGS